MHTAQSHPLSNRLLADSVSELLREAAVEAEVDLRIRQRHPFFRPAVIACADARRRSHSAFCRDISPAGVGLLHNFPLNPGEVIVTIATKKGRNVSVRTDIVWCKPCGEGWYISGGRFLSS
jgi:hypothetical protein